MVDVIDREQFLATFPAFRGAPESTLGTILGEAQLLDLSAGAVMYRPGEVSQGIGLLLSGLLRVYRASSAGREITLYEVEPGQTCVLNISCILANRTYPVYAEVVEAGRMLFLGRDLVARLMTESEHMRTFVHSLYATRLDMVMELLEEVVFGRLEDRLSEYLLTKSENAILEATHQRIANDLGSSREVVSRMLKQLEREGKVRIGRGTVEIVNLQ